MTVYTIYAATSDHYVESPSTVYSTARSGGGTKTDHASDTEATAGQMKEGANYIVRQYFAAFDASAVPVGTDNSLSMSLNIIFNDGGSKTYQIADRDWSGGTGDFVAGASLSGLTDRASGIITGTGVKSWSFTSPVLARSVVELLLYPKDQEDNVAPVGVERLYFSAANDTGTTNDPYLTFDATPAIGRSFGVIIA